MNPIYQSQTNCPDLSKTVLKVPGILSKTEQAEREQGAVSLSMLWEHYRFTVWTRVFTNGSANEATKIGVGVIYITHLRDALYSRRVDLQQFKPGGAALRAAV